MNKTEIKSLSFPGDKSIAHRLILFSLLVNKKIIIKNLPNSLDVNTSLEIVKKLGVKVSSENEKTIIESDGLNKKVFKGESILNCGNSGTTARLLCGILSNFTGKFKLIGDNSLSKRPMERVVRPLADLMGVKIRSTEGHLPIYIEAEGKTKSADFFNQTGSAQVKSAVLFAGMAADGKTTVRESLLSRDHTERLLKYVDAHKVDECLIFNVPGDISSAAYFVVLSAITGKKLTIKNVLLNPTRIGFFYVLERMGVDIEKTITEDIWEPIGDISINSRNLVCTDIKPEEIPSVIDELPILAIAMAFAKGKSRVFGASELRVKESDRITCLISQLKKAGVNCSEYKDGYEIVGDNNFKSAELNSFNDHRLAMSFEILSKCANLDLKIKGTDSINISFPDFYKYLSNIDK